MSCWCQYPFKTYIGLYRVFIGSLHRAKQPFKFNTLQHMNTFMVPLKVILKFKAVYCLSFPCSLRMPKMLMSSK